MSLPLAAKALIVDFGGVLTTSIWPAFAQFCESEGLEPDTVLKLFRGDSEAFGRLLGVADHEDLTQRLFAGLRPDERMIGAVHAARAAGVKTGLITNSWGMGIYERAPLDLFDERVISGEVGMHKPQPEIYLLACERLEVEPAEAVFVDDLRENVEGAEAVGMAAVLHRESEKTIAKLEELLAVSLRASA
jgi:putative hydrolase of the HAD superfamily